MLFVPNAWRGLKPSNKRSVLTVLHRQCRDKNRNVKEPFILVVGQPSHKLLVTEVFILHFFNANTCLQVILKFWTIYLLVTNLKLIKASIRYLAGNLVQGQWAQSTIFSFISACYTDNPLQLFMQLSTKLNQHLMGWSLGYGQLFHKLTWKSVEYFFRYPGDRQTNKPTDRRKT